MGFEIDVHYRNGRIDHFESKDFSSQFGGGVFDDLCVRFDADIAVEGLVVELRHFEVQQPGEDDFDYAPDHRGYPCGGRADAWPVLVSPEEAEDVSAIYYGSKLAVCRMGDSLVNLANVSQLASLYLSDENMSASYLNIAYLYAVFAERYKTENADPLNGEVGDDAMLDAVAGELGLPPSVVRDALAYEEYTKHSSGEPDEGGDATDGAAGLPDAAEDYNEGFDDDFS